MSDPQAPSRRPKRRRRVPSPRALIAKLYLALDRQIDELLDEDAKERPAAPRPARPRRKS